MTKEKQMLIQVLARLDVVEAKINELLKKFGADEEDLWDLSEHVFRKTLEHLTEQKRDAVETLQQSELF